MANNSLSSRLEGLRSGLPQSDSNDRVYSGFNTPSRYSGSFMQSQAAMSSADVRSHLQRRFTTNSDAAPNVLSLGQPNPSNTEQMDLAKIYRMQNTEKKRLEFEILRQKRKDFERELEKFQQRQAQEYQELQQMAHELNTLDLNKWQQGSMGHMSEPSTPPSERISDYGFPSIYSRHNRYSSSSMISPPTAANSMSRSGSMLTSPQYEASETLQSKTISDKLPSKSVPGSRRGSNDRMSAYFAAELAAIGQNQKANNNRYSMPVTSSMAAKRMSVADDSGILDQVNTANFLFGDDEDKPVAQTETVTSPGGKTYLQVHTTEDKFPILLRHTEAPTKRPATHASNVALDLAGADLPPASGSGVWPTSVSRHRAGQQSLPQNLFDADFSPAASATSSARQSLEISSPPAFTVRPSRHSMEASMASSGKNLFSQGSNTPTSRPTLGSMQPSYSTNDVPTIKNSMNLNLVKSPTKPSAEDAFHKHNASLGRIPPGAINRASRDLSTITSKMQEPAKDERPKPSPPQGSTIQATAATFGPSIAATLSGEPSLNQTAVAAVAQFNNPAYYGGYGMQFMNMGMNPAQLGSPSGFQSPLYQYQAQGQYGFYPPTAPNSNIQNGIQNGQGRNAGQRRAQNTDDGSRFSHARIESYQGEIYNLCKDQHGCRYLQRQLETRDLEISSLIFEETQQHVVELMTDPFGNYLCQKLLEHANDEQRTVLVNNAAPQMVKIALNQHGTRALQKMIEYISTQEQTQTIIDALRDKVVTLIQDLNGNHVIQKCLNRLSSEDSQFIFDAVGTNCVVVGTHRHGCCVLQRCIDHASGQQRKDLVQHITRSAYSLVQDPFGNYVLQYIIDLKDASYINPLCYVFRGNVVGLSKHKFSSNVIEKMIRGADPHVSADMVEEMMNGHELESMLKDQFANYVVQTALDYTELSMRQRLVDAIKPMLPAIRQTPYGRRIQSKITAIEGALASRTTTSGDGAQRMPLISGNDTILNTPQRQNGSFSSFSQPSFGMSGMTSAVVANGLNSDQMNGSTGIFNPYAVPNGPNDLQRPFSGFNQPTQQSGFGYF